MRYYILFVLIIGASYAAASLLVAVIGATAWPATRARVGRLAPVARARVLAAWRLGPAAAGAAWALVVAGAFIRFEPGDTTEVPGVLLAVAACFTGVLGLQAAVRLGRAVRSTCGCARLLRECGRRVERDDGLRLWVVDTEYPVAAVHGIFRAQLVLSTRILAECTPGEIDAVLRHEQAHVSRRDNLVRAAMLALPNPLSLFRAGREMQAVWSAAVEESADDAAAGAEATSRAALASALVRVARMARTPAPDWVPALAFYEGANLEHRVRRLLEARESVTGIAAGSVIAGAAAVAGCALALTDMAAREVHAWMEIAVHFVP